jgi:hypothetical protein
MASKKTKDQQVACRLAPDMHRQFVAKAALHNGTSFVLRELVRAFIENRLTILPPKEGSIYALPTKEIL